MLITNNITGETTEVEDTIVEPMELTPHQQAYQIQQQLDALDNPRDAEDVYMAMINNTPLSAQTLERFEKKQALREQLRALLNLT